METNSVGANRAFKMLIGEGEAGRWIHPIVRNWGFLYLGFVFLGIWLPNKATTPTGSEVLRWIATYAVYLFALEILGRLAKRLYDGTLFRLFRIHFNLAMIAILALVAPPTASGYLWFFFSGPLVATLGYLGRFFPLLAIYVEVCAAMLLLTFAQGWTTPLDLAAMVAKDALLGLLAAVLYFFVHRFPRLREESTLLEAATTLLKVLNSKELCQLLADAATAGIPAAEAAVVHLLEGERNRALVPRGSSHLDLTTLGQSPMEIGVGIAGHAIQSRETINVPDVNKDNRYHPLPPSFTSFRSLLVAPMYVGAKNVGTTSVHSARGGAFGKRDERFLTALAAQGATAIANAELYDTRKRRRRQISDILEASRTFGLHQPLDTLLDTIAAEVCRCSGYRMAVVNLLDKAGNEIMVKAMAGVPPAGRRKLEGMCIPLDMVKSLYQDEFRISRSYFVRHDRRPKISDLDQYTFTADLCERKPGEWHQEDMLIVPIQTQEEELLGYISMDDPSDRQLPSLDTVQALEILASVAATAIQNAKLYEQAQQEITERKRAEESLAQQQYLLQTFMDNVPDNIYFKDTESRFIRINQALANWFGLSDPAQALGKTDFDFFSDQHAQQAYEDEQDVMRTGKPLSMEEKETWPDGRVTWVATTKMPLRNQRGKVFGTFGISKDITKRKQAEEALQERNRELELLNRVSQALVSTLDLDQVLVTVLEGLRHLLGVTASSVWLIDPASDELVCRQATGPQSEIVRGWRLAPGEGLANSVVRSGESLVMPDTRADKRHFKGVDQQTGLEVRSTLIIPLRLKQNVIGVLQVVDTEVDRFKSTDLAFGESLAATAASAIENARLFEQEREQRELAEALTEAAAVVSSTLNLDQVLDRILEQVERVFAGDAFSVMLIKDDVARLARWRGYELPGEVRQPLHFEIPIAKYSNLMKMARTGKPVVVVDTSVDPDWVPGARDQGWRRSYVGAPIQVGDVTVGFLNVSGTQPGQFSLDDAQRLQAFANHAATAIENAWLYEETDSLRAFNENIVQSMEEAILLENASGHITFVNRRMAEMLGYAPEELIGQHWTVTAAPEEMAKIEEEVAKRPQGITSRYETVLLTKKGQRVPAIVSATPLFEEGSFTGVLAAFTDITDRKRQETRLLDYLSTVTSNLAQHTSLEGLYEFIVEAGARFLSARDCALFLVSNENRDALKLVAAVASPLCGDRSSAISTAISAGPGCGLVGHVAETCQPIRLLGEEIFQHRSWNKELWTRLGWDSDPEAHHSLLAAPMCLPDGRLVGVLVARDADSRGGFSEFDEVLIQTLATNAAADIERVRGLEEAREDAIRAERKRLETDLHEAMNVLATGVRWEAEIISDEIERGDLAAARFALTRLQAARTCASTDLRYILEDLRDPTLEQEGLLIALRKRADLIGRGRIQVHGDVWERPSPEVEGILYRIGQEAMDNAVRHSGVIHDPDVEIEVGLERSDEQAKLCVRDNGIGFDVESALALSHKWGLRRLRDMLREMGGRLDIDSAPGKGTTICATIDLTRRNHEQ